MAKRILKTTKYYLDEVKDEEAVKQLEALFNEFEGFKQTMVEEYRKTAEALADLDISKAMATKAMGKFLRVAGSHIPMVAVEPQWWIYRNKEGKIVLESAFTERDIRNATRAQKAGLSREISSSDGAELFEDDDADEKTTELGFD